jgi:hypothetical protein
MSKKGLQRTALAPSFSSGPVHFRIVDNVGYQTTAEIGVDYSKADVPERAYYADYVDVQRGRSGINLLFGKLVPRTTQLRTQVEIIFPDDMFLRQLWGTTRDVHKMLLEYRPKWRIEPMDTATETDKVQTFRSNNVFIGTWGDEAVADFYYLSPRDFYLVKAGSKTRVGLEPVLRIVLYPGLLLEFFEKCKELVPALEASPQEVINV